ncbi:MAG: DUF1467 family protein [Mesorhizobium sp.]|nr:DUF1467 family protein [Mesorhizobium sp.]MBN9245376.1 DUF1467 family protein [Mesorhizobium sp.]
MSGGSTPTWNWISMVAVYFVVWWITLFAILPFSFQAQDEQEEVVPGTHSSAPKKPRLLYIVVWTSIWAIIVLGTYYAVTAWLGFSVDDLPQILPEYNR